MAYVQTVRVNVNARRSRGEYSDQDEVSASVTLEASLGPEDDVGEVTRHLHRKAKRALGKQVPLAEIEASAEIEKQTPRSQGGGEREAEAENGNQETGNEGFQPASEAETGDVDMVTCEVELSGLSDTDFEAAQNWIKSETHPQTGERVFSFDEDEKVWRGDLPRARAGNLEAFITDLDGGSEVRILEEA